MEVLKTVITSLGFILNILIIWKDNYFVYTVIDCECDSPDTGPNHWFFMIIKLDSLMITNKNNLYALFIKNTEEMFWTCH